MHDIIASTGILDHYYADDTQEYQSFHLKPGAIDQQLAFSCLSASITEQKKWLSNNRLKLNSEKTDALLVSSPSNVKSLVSCPLELGDALIIPSPVVRNLGVLLDSHLTMDHQIHSTCRKAYFHLLLVFLSVWKDRRSIQTGVEFGQLMKSGSPISFFLFDTFW
jgi:hypothetical protein